MRWEERIERVGRVLSENDVGSTIPHIDRANNYNEIVEWYLKGLDILGYELNLVSEKDNSQLNFHEVEYLSELQHENMFDILSKKGWSYSDTFDAERLRSPYLRHWNELPYSMKERHRNMVRSFIPTVELAGYEIFRSKSAIGEETFNSQYRYKWFDEPDAPIIVSMTGHWDANPDYHDHIESEIRKVLSNLRDSCPHTRIVFLTALDEGMDMFATRIALEEGAFIAPVFPMDFFTYMGERPNRDISEVDRILAHDRCFDPYVLGLDKDDPEAYRFLAIELIVHSHLLISVWNGKDGKFNGGAFDTTDMALHGIRPDLKKRFSIRFTTNCESERVSYFDMPDDCPVYWIECNRERPSGIKKSGISGFLLPDSVSGYEGEMDNIFELFIYGGSKDRPSSEHEFGSWGVMNLYDKLPKPYPRLFRYMDSFNKEFCKMVEYKHTIDGRIEDVSFGLNDEGRSMIEGSASRNYHYLHEYKKDVTTPGEHYENAKKLQSCKSFDAMANRYSISDNLSMKCQNITKDELFHLGEFTVISTALFSLLMLANAPLIINIMYTIAAGVLFLYSVKHRADRSFHRYIDYRCISEYYRVEYYRSVMGIRDPFAAPSYGYMRNELMWVRAVIKGWGANFANRDNYIPYGVDTLDVGYHCWVRGQELYHSKKKITNSKLLGSREKLALIISGVTLILSALLFASDIFFEDLVFYIWEGFSINGIRLHGEFMFNLENVIKIVMIITVAIGTYTTYSKDRVFGGTPNEIDAKQRMFTTASREYERMCQNPKVTDGIDDRLILFHQLGDIAITEVNDWVFEHKARDFKKSEKNLDTLADKRT